MTDITSELKARLIVGRKQDGRCVYDPKAKRELTLPRNNVQQSRWIICRTEATMSEKNVPNRRYTEEFREEAARLANSVGHNEAARRLGVPVATIGNWARLQLKQGVVSVAEVAVPAPRTKPAVSELEAENSRLRKELASAKLDIEILSKATAYFAKGSR